MGPHVFMEDDDRQYLSARFWNQSGKQMAVVAVITKGVDWAAYIGTDAPDSWHEQDTYVHVAEWGCKLTREDALYFFPEMEAGPLLPYRP